jgi:excisionase family DNA binding protein
MGNLKVSRSAFKDSGVVESMEEPKKIRPQFLDVKAAEMLRVKPRTIYDWVSQGRIPYRKARDRRILFLDEIINWIKPS